MQRMQNEAPIIRPSDDFAGLTDLFYRAGLEVKADEPPALGLL